MKIFLSVILLILAIVFWRYLLHGVIGAAFLGFFGSLFGDGWMVFGGLIGFLIGLGAAHNDSQRTVETSTLQKTEILSEGQPKGVLRKTRDALVGFLVLAILIVGFVSFTSKPKSIGAFDVISYVFFGPVKHLIFSPVKYLIRKRR